MTLLCLHDWEEVDPNSTGKVVLVYCTKCRQVVAWGDD